MPIRLALFTVAIGLLMSGGCGPAKLKLDKTYSIPAGQSEIIDLPAISKPQKITVEFSSSTTEVAVYLIKDYEDADGKDVVPAKNKILEMKEAKSGTFTADVPAKTATRVAIMGGRQKTEVSVKLNNSK